MRSFILAIALTGLVSALYAMQNDSLVLVRFLSLERELPQGLWDIVFFASGALLMWIFSIAAAGETHSKYRAKIKELEKKLSDLKDEKESMLNVFKHLPDSHTMSLPAFAADDLPPASDEEPAKESAVD